MKPLPESVKALVKKVSRLMKEGATGGEKLAAKTALERIAQSNGITLEDLGVLDERSVHTIPIIDGDEDLWNIQMLIIRKFFPDCELKETAGATHISGQKWIVYHGLFTDLDYAVCWELMDEYGKAYQKHRDEVFVAWINVNDLVKCPDTFQGEMTPQYTEEQLRRIREQAKLVVKVDMTKKLI